MDNFKIIYRILKLLEEAMDYDQFHTSMLTPELLGVSENRLNHILKMLQESGYITGIIYRAGLSEVKLNRPEITLKGLEYLEENSIMKKVAGLLKGIKETVPGL